MVARTKDTYTTDDIKKMDFPVAIQKRPSMYMDDAAKDAETPGQKNVAVREILDNAVTEAMKGYANHVTLTFHPDGSVSILDNGRGLPIDTNSAGQNGIIATLADLHSGANFENVKGGKVGPGVHGVGGACTNALSERFDVTVYRGAYAHMLSFQNGYPGHFNGDEFTPDENIVKEKCKHEQGTLIHFKLNDEFFVDVENIIIDDLIDRCRYTVYVVPGLTIDVIDETRPPEEGGGNYTFHSKDGLRELVDFISTGEPAVAGKGDEYEKKGIHTVKTIGKYKKNYVDISSGKAETVEMEMSVPIEVAFRWNQDDQSEMRSFANSVQTHRGGIAEDALKEALMDTFGKEASKGFK